jgi:putative DNA primase/helicase
MSAASIAAALGAGHRSGRWWRCCCPAHNSRRASLALQDGPRGLIVHCHAGCPRKAVLEELHRLGLLDGDGSGVSPIDVEQQRAAEKQHRERRIAAALDFWRNETLLPAGTVVERYWGSRGLALPVPPKIRASRSWLRHPEGVRPAMVALIEHIERGPVAVHRTFLAIDGSGKASFRSPRLSLGPVGGAAVRLGDAGQELMVGEGIETTAAAMTATGLSGWAALSAGGIEALVLPPLPLASTVIVLADHDSNGVGERAARIAARRWLAEGRRVRIALPPEPGTDMADVLVSHGDAAAAESDNVAA